jgi:hypothetical protein
MSVEVVPGGQRRIDRVLDPRFTDRVDQPGLAELARRSVGEHRSWRGPGCWR